MSNHNYAYLSHLRLALAILVIAHHAGQAFGPTGGSWPVFSVERSPVLGVFFAVNAAFFMGLFFLIAGFLAYKSILRSGARTFMARKLKRLGIPTLIVALGVFLPMAYLSFGRSMSPGVFLVRLYTDHWPALFGHLWFLVHLLVYSGILAIAVTLGAFRLPPSSPAKLTTAGVVLAILGITVVTAVVRIRYPIDDWRTVALFIPSEVAHLPQYATLFVAGVFAARHDWFERLSWKSGRRWLVVGVLSGALRYVRWAVPAFSRAVPLATGGFNLGSALWSAWETVICIGMSVGLIALFRRYADRRSALLARLSGGSYFAYIAHVFVLVPIQLGLLGLPMTPFLKFALSALIAVAVTFAVGDAVRRVPAVRAVV